MGVEEDVSKQLDEAYDLADKQDIAEAEQAGENDSNQNVEAESATENKLSYDDLVDALEDMRAKADDHWNKLLRSRAEIENLRQRHIKDRENTHKYALERFSQELLQVRDSLELGVNAAQLETDVSKLREGTEMTLKLLTSAMEKFNLTQINPQGEKFDPDRHQAMQMQERSDVESNTVVQVMQKGYLLNDRLLRAAMVIVAKNPTPAVTPEQENNSEET